MQQKFFNGFIYKLVSPHTNSVYIGSTGDTLSRRMANHRYHYKKFVEDPNFWITCSSYDIMKFGDVQMIVLNEVKDVTRQELKRLEGLEILNHSNCVNRIVAGRTIRESQKRYYDNNKDRLRDYQRVYYANKRKMVTC